MSGSTCPSPRITVLLSTSLLSNRECWWLPSIAISMSQWTWKPVSGDCREPMRAECELSGHSEDPKSSDLATENPPPSSGSIHLLGNKALNLFRCVLGACISTALFIWTEPSDDWSHLALPCWRLCHTGVSTSLWSPWQLHVTYHPFLCDLYSSQVSLWSFIPPVLYPWSEIKDHINQIGCLDTLLWASSVVLCCLIEHAFRSMFTLPFTKYIAFSKAAWHQLV